MQQTNKFPEITLNNGKKIPQVGLGTFLSANQKIFTDLLRAALDAGYRHIDTARLYQNHKIIGNALQTIYQEGKYKREDIFITTKIFPNPAIDAVSGLKESLTELQTTYIDLYLVHFPVFPYGKDPKITSKPQHVLWAEMEQCIKLGLAHSIGVSNYNVQSLLDLLSYCEIKPVINQFELSVYLQQDDLVNFCQKMNIAVTAYSSLARGGDQVKQLFGQKADLFNDPVLLEISKKYKKSIAQIVLNFITSKNVIVLPKTEKIERLKDNIEFFDFKLQLEDVEKIQKLDKGLRTVDTIRENWGYLNIFA